MFGIKLLPCLCFVLLVSGCNRLFFFPMKEHLFSPDKVNLPYEDVFFNSLDRTGLHGWFIPSIGKSRGTVVFLHGNAQNISTHVGAVIWLPRNGFNVFLFDYRGYGKSSGFPQLERVMDDVESAFDVLFRRTDIDHDRVVVFAQSLGATIALYAVPHSKYRNCFKALIVESAFSGYRAIAREKLADFFLTWPLQWPLSLLFTNEFNPMQSAAMIAPVPLLVIHSYNDQVIPVHHGLALYAAALQPKQLWLIQDFRHIEAMIDATNRKRLVDYILEQIDPAVRNNRLQPIECQ